MNNISGIYKSLALAHKKLQQLRFDNFDLTKIFCQKHAIFYKDRRSGISIIPRFKSIKQKPTHSDRIFSDELTEVFANAAEKEILPSSLKQAIDNCQHEVGL